MNNNCHVNQVSILMLIISYHGNDTDKQGSKFIVLNYYYDYSGYKTCANMNENCIGRFISM